MPRRFKAGRIKQTRSRKQTATFAKSVMGDGTHIETLPTDRLMAQERENDPVFHSQRKLGGTIDDSIPFPPTVFYWPGQYTLAATTGTTPTFTRATSATFEDFEGVIRTADSSEPRFVGARRVENLITASEDMTNAAYADQLGAVSAATQTVFDGTANGSVYQLVTITDDGSGVGGRTFVFSAEIALVSGTLTSGTDIRIQGNAMTAVTSDISSLITATPQRFSVTASTDAAGTNVEPIIRCDDAATLLITKWQVEEVTGQTNQNPSEYVSTGVGTGAEELVNGDDWVGATGTTPPNNWTTLGGSGTYEVASGQLTQDRNGDSALNADMSQTIATVAGKEYSIEYKIVSNTSTGVQFTMARGSPSFSAQTPVAGVVQRILFTATAATATISVRPSTTLTQIVVWDYISVKEASHGANIDGVQYFNTLNANTVTAGVVTEATGSALTSATTQFIEIDGVAGSYVSTPDSVASSIRQSITLEADCAADDWATVNKTLNAKYDWGTGRSWLFRVMNTGKLELALLDQSATIDVAQSTVLGFADGSRHKIQAKWDAVTKLVTFSEFIGGAWVVISTDTLNVDSIGDFATRTTVGAWGSGSGPFNGKIYSSTVTKGPTAYPYVLLDGVSGTYVSTPDSAANSVTGDLTLIAWLAPDDWTPAAYEVIIAKDRNGSASREYFMGLNGPSGDIRFLASETGAAYNLDAISTAGVGFADGTGHWVRVTYNSVTGDVDFYTSDDSASVSVGAITWTQLGATVSETPTAIFDGINSLEIGSQIGGASSLSGKVSRAVVIKSTDPTAAASVDFYPQPYLQGDTNFTSVTGELWTLQGNAIATSPIDDGVKVDCDAGDYVSGSTFVSSTSGETWTLNGNASVFQPPVDASGPFGYLAEGARTNICLQSNAFDTTWTKGGGSRVTSAYAIAPDGTNTAWQLLDSGATGLGEVYAYQFLTVAGGSSTYSIYVKEDQLNLVSLQTLDFDAGGNGTSFFNLATGAWGTQSANHTVHSQSLGNGWYRLAVSLSTASDLAGRVLVYCVATDGTNAGVPLDGTSSILIWGAQVEAGAFPSSYIATAAASVTRNADVLTAPAAGNADTFPMTINLNITPSALLANSSAISVDDGSSDRAFIYQDGTDWVGYITDGGVPQAQIINGAITPLGVPASLTLAASLNDTNFYFNGSPGTVDTACTMPATPTTIRIGARYDNAMQPYASIRNVKIFDKRLTDAEVADL